MADDVITFKQNAIINKLETMEQKRKNEQKRLFHGTGYAREAEKMIFLAMPGNLAYNDKGIPS